MPSLHTPPPQAYSKLMRLNLLKTNKSELFCVVSTLIWLHGVADELVNVYIAGHFIQCEMLHLYISSSKIHLLSCLNVFMSKLIIDEAENSLKMTWMLWSRNIKFDNNGCEDATYLLIVRGFNTHVAIQFNKSSLELIQLHMRASSLTSLLAWRYKVSSSSPNPHFLRNNIES